MRPREASAFLGRLNFLLSISTHQWAELLLSRWWIVRQTGTKEKVLAGQTNMGGRTVWRTCSISSSNYSRICLPLFLTSAVNSARKWWYTLMSVSANIETGCGFYFSTKKPKVNLSAMQPVMTGSCRCGMTPPLIHASSADGTKRRFGARRTSTR